MKKLWFAVQAIYTLERKLVGAELGEVRLQIPGTEPPADGEITKDGVIVVTKWCATKPEMKRLLKELRAQL